MSDWRDELKRIVAEDSERQDAVAEAEQAQRVNLDKATNLIRSEVIPALEAVREALRESGLPGMEITAKLNDHPHVVAMMPRTDRPALEVMIAMDAMPATTHVFIQTGKYADRQRDDFPGGIANVTQQTVIDEVLKCYERGLQELVSSEGDLPGRRVVQGSI